MKRGTLFFLVFLLTLICGYAQKPVLIVTLIDRSSKEASKFMFKIEVKNVGYAHYWMQDTNYLAAQVEYPNTNFIYSLLWKKTNGKYLQYEKPKHHGDPIPEDGMDSCLKCIDLKKGESITFTAKLLACCTLDTGSYRIETALFPPVYSPNPRKQMEELRANYVYFSVK